MKEKNVALILFIMCFLLTIGIFIQIKTVDNAAIGVGSNSKQNELRNEILKIKEEYNRTVQSLENRQKELDELIKNIDDDETTSNYNQRLEYLNNLLGYNKLKGKGIIITLEDGKGNQNSIDISESLVHDKDLLQVVNSLINAGAEAIDINGQRIVSTTAITCIGNVIKINNEKVGTPYVISAIGLTENLYGALTMPGGYLSILKNLYKLEVNVEKSNSVTVEKYNGIYKLEYATINE